MRKELIELTTKRLDSDEVNAWSTIRYLKKYRVEEYIDLVISTVYLYTRPKRGTTKNSIYFVEVISAIGHSVRNKLKLKRDSGLAARTGAFLLYNFDALKLIEVTLGAGANGHNAYIVTVLNDDVISDMWAKLESSKIEKLPSLTPYAPWESARHETGAQLVKTGNKEVLELLRPESHPIVFSCVNKAQQIGWTINKEIYDLHSWALRNKADAFADIWELTNAEAKATKLREARAIGDIAKRFVGKTFYHLYYYDFRGRKYPSTAYLHEQGSDLARGLLLRADKKPITVSGFFWLMVSIASSWAGDAGRDDGQKTDKIPLRDRYSWSMDNEEILLSYAESPKVHQGWMSADKPWQFLAACIELRKLREWQMEHGDPENPTEDYSYESHLEAYIDGSNNGSQHLAALTKDEVTAPHVNLVPLPLPGDLYKYVADFEWSQIDKRIACYTKEELKGCDHYIDTLIDYKRQIAATEMKSELRKELVEKIRLFKQKDGEFAELSAPVFWGRIRDNKHRRKIVKRNVMTLPYGGTAYGLGEQQISDAKKHGIDLLFHMEHKWAAWLGREIYESCRISLKKPMQLLNIFEQAGKKAETEGRFLKWTVPVTNFPVVQNYTEGTTRKIWVQYGPQEGEKLNTGHYRNTLQLAVCFIEETRPSRGKQSQSAAPNAIHSLDAAHLALTVHRADYGITTIHDSFGCLLADMQYLFKDVRQSFVDLYKENPLDKLMEDIGGDATNLELGSLDVSLVLDSEYAFS